MGKRAKSVYYGWWIVLTAFVSAMLLFAPTVNLLSLFTDPVCSDFGIDRSRFTLYYTVVTVAGMVASPIAGIALRRFDARACLACFVLLGAVSYAGLSMASGIGAFYVLGVLQGFALMGGCVVPASVLVTNWFGDRRGLPLGIALAGSGVGGVLLSPLVAALIAGAGWRLAYAALAAMTAVVLLPLVVFVVRFRPADKGLSVPGSQASDSQGRAGERQGVQLPDDSEQGATRAEALRTPTFWTLCLAVVVTGLVSNTMLVNLAPYLTDLGMEYGAAALVLSLTSAMVIVGKVLVGRLFDRFGLVKIVVALGMCNLASLASLALVPHMAGGVGYAVFTGLGATAFTIAPTYVTASVFGQRDFSAIFGVVSAFSSLGSALSPVFGSAALSLGGSWGAVLAMLCALAVAGTALYTVAVRKRRSVCDGQKR